MLTKKGRKRTFGGPVKKEFFQPGDLVFAKVKGHPHWPCRIDEVDEAKSLKMKRYHIFFFGTHEIAHLAVENIWPYEENKKRFGKHRSTKGFNESLAEIQEFADNDAPVKTSKVKARQVKSPQVKATPVTPKHEQGNEAFFVHNRLLYP